MSPDLPPDPHTAVKRSLTIAGHPTSIRLERLFWQEIERIAAAEHRSLASLVAEIDRRRPASLASALRVFVLRRRIDEIGENQAAEKPLS